jgi:tRNA (cytidine/uridine-2'-O-)-methyltransferase
MPARPRPDGSGTAGALIAPIAAVANILLSFRKAPMRLALFQPDIPGNVGAVLRTCACLGVPLDLIEPLGFAWDDKRVRRSAMDYYDRVEITRHPGWEAFRAAVPGRLALMTSRGSVPIADGRFEADDVILMGSESTGAPDFVHDAAALRIRIPIAAGLRSLNLSVAAGIALHEALRQVGELPISQDRSG